MPKAPSELEAYIHFYNHGRSQRKLNKLTPVKYRRQLTR
ncbi:IS3 family transposase [Paenibacillus sp. GCM10023250]